jgi:RND family efflux transporter MFP subunit
MTPPLRIPALLFIAFLLTGCGAEAGPPFPSEPPVPVVEVAEARRADAPPPIRASGRLAAKSEADLAFKIDGVVQDVLVDEGDRVEKGEVLARLDLSEISARVQEAESALEKARRDLERTRRLYRDSVATREEMQDARTAVDVAEARVQAARFNRRHAVIQAPSAGRILRRRAEEGEYVSPGRPVVTLAAADRGWVVRAGLPARDVVRVALGDTARVAFDAFPGETAPARVTEIADAADPRTGTFEVELTVSDAAGRLKSGFIARVRLTPSTAARPVEIPASALVTGDGERGVVLRLDSTRSVVTEQPVTIAHLRDSTLALAGGLAAGEVVVTTGAAGLRDGDSVRVKLGVKGER